jgi:hypothetical protein
MLNTSLKMSKWRLRYVSCTATAPVAGSAKLISGLTFVDVLLTY